MAKIKYKSHLLTDGKKAANGYKEYKLLMTGKQLTHLQSIKAFCFECLGGYADGICDCQCYECPLYGYHYYRYGRNTPKKD